ncbi:hypothetical protein ACHAWF_018083, partial [Thalassiosira exigua]
MTVITLSLNNNQIGDKGAASLASALGDNARLKHLELGSNIIGHVGAECFENALKQNDALETLVLDGNNIGDEGAACFTAALIMGSSHLKRLDLRRNGIGIDGAKSLAEMFSRKNSLTELRLDDNIFGINEGRKIFDAALEGIASNCKVQLGKDRLGKKVASKHHEKAPRRENEMLPRTSLELSLQTKTKTQSGRI